MDLNKIQGNLIGEWTGINRLRLNCLTPLEYFSSADLSVSLVAKGTFLTINNTWGHENISQEVMLVVGHDQISQLPHG